MKLLATKFAKTPTQVQKRAGVISPRNALLRFPGLRPMFFPQLSRKKSAGASRRFSSTQIGSRISESILKIEKSELRNNPEQGESVESELQVGRQVEDLRHGVGVTFAIDQLNVHRLPVGTGFEIDRIRAIATHHGREQRNFFPVFFRCFEFHAVADHLRRKLCVGTGIQRFGKIATEHDDIRQNDFRRRRSIAAKEFLVLVEIGTLQLQGFKILQCRRISIQSPHGFVLRYGCAHERDFNLPFGFNGRFERHTGEFQKAAACQFKERSGIEHVLLLPLVLIEREFHILDLSKPIVAFIGPHLAEGRQRRFGGIRRQIARVHERDRLAAKVCQAAKHAGAFTFFLPRLPLFSRWRRTIGDIDHQRFHAFQQFGGFRRIARCAGIFGTGCGADRKRKGDRKHKQNCQGADDCWQTSHCDLLRSVPEIAARRICNRGEPGNASLQGRQFALACYRRVPYKSAATARFRPPFQGIAMLPLSIIYLRSLPQRLGVVSIFIFSVVAPTPSWAQLSPTPDAEHSAEQKAKSILAQLQTNLTTAKRELGEDSIAAADAHSALGNFYRAIGDYKNAEAFLLDDYKIRLQKCGEESVELIDTLNNLSLFYHELGVFERAVQSQSQALRIAKKEWGELDFRTANMYGRLAELHCEMSDFGKAQAVCMAAIQIDRKLLGNSHPETARLIGLLAHIYAELGYYEWAEKYFQQSLPILEKAYGGEHFETLKLVKNVGLFYAAAGRNEDAERVLRQVLPAVEKNAGAKNIATAKVQSYLASALVELGQIPEALQHSARALRTCNDLLPTDEHPLFVEPLRDAGMANLAANQISRAEALFFRALSISEHQLRQSSAIETERQQITHAMAMRMNLDLYLSLPSAAKPDADVEYTSALFWKGIAASRQRARRAKHNQAADAEAAEHEKLCARLAQLQLHVPDPDGRNQWMEQIRTLTLEKEALEQDLAALAGQTDDPTKQMHTLPADLQQALPAGIALVDLLEYELTSFVAERELMKPQRETHFVAFIVRHDRPVLRVELGAAKLISEAIEKWSQTRGFGPADGQPDPAAAVSDLIWRPIAPHLDGCKTILISPDGVLANIAWNILPGTRPESYLIEDLAIGIVPVPQMLPAMLVENRQADMAQQSMLLVGDVDYDAALKPAGDTNAASSSADSTDGGELMTFAPLKSTGPEVRALADQFKRRFPTGQVSLLDKAAATETAFRREAPKNRWLHVATHGFFSPPGIKAALCVPAQIGGTARPNGDPTTLFNVGLLSGLALAGANGRATMPAAFLRSLLEDVRITQRSIHFAGCSGSMDRRRRTTNRVRIRHNRFVAHRSRGALRLRNWIGPGRDRRRRARHSTCDASRRRANHGQQFVERARSKNTTSHAALLRKPVGPQAVQARGPARSPNVADAHRRKADERCESNALQTALAAFLGRLPAQRRLALIFRNVDPANSRSKLDSSIVRLIGTLCRRPIACESSLPMLCKSSQRQQSFV